MVQWNTAYIRGRQCLKCKQFRNARELGGLDLNEDSFIHTRTGGDSYSSLLLSAVYRCG